MCIFEATLSSESIHFFDKTNNATFIDSAIDFLDFELFDVIATETKFLLVKVQKCS